MAFEALVSETLSIGTRRRVPDGPRRSSDRALDVG